MEPDADRNGRRSGRPGRTAPRSGVGIGDEHAARWTAPDQARRYDDDDPREAGPAMAAGVAVAACGSDEDRAMTEIRHGPPAGPGGRDHDRAGRAPTGTAAGSDGRSGRSGPVRPRIDIVRGSPSRVGAGGSCRVTDPRRPRRRARPDATTPRRPATDRRRSGSSLTRIRPDRTVSGSSLTSGRIGAKRNIPDRPIKLPFTRPDPRFTL